jgi:transcriptional regulator with XRE-family HTH domain
MLLLGKSIEKIYIMSNIGILYPEQCRAARALLNWSQAELAERASVAKQTLADFERGARSPYPRTLADIKKALEVEGIEFLNGGSPGARLKRKQQAGRPGS